MRDATCIYVSMKRVESDSLLGYSRKDYNTLIHESIRGLRLGLWRHLATALKLCITSTFLVLIPRDSSLIGSKGFEISNLVFVAARVSKSCVREEISLKTFTLEKKMRMITIIWSANPNARDSLLWLKGYFMLKISPLTDFRVHDRTWNLFALVVV